MALKVNVRKATEVPRPTSTGRVNQNLEALKAKMTGLSPGMVLEVEVDRGTSVRGTKALITRAAREIGGSRWKHWHAGNKVFAQPTRARRRRRRSAARK